MTSILCKRPVAFRVPRADVSTAGQSLGTEWRLFQDERTAQEEADALGTDYQGLYVRDGTAIVAEWEPIETAPKDGTPFLCFHHDPEFSPPTSIDLIWYEPSIKTYTMDGDSEVPFAGITHWMPLPAPPQSRALVGAPHD